MSDEPFIPAFDVAEHVIAPWSGALAVDTAWTIVMGSLVAVSCGWIGCYLILRGLALIGDAISHTLLLGIVIAFLLTGQVSGVAMFIAAAVTGVLTTSLIEFVQRSSRIKEETAIGIVFTSLFALGVVLLSTLASHAHIDTQHVLFGDIAFALLDQTTIVGRLVPVAVCQMSLVVLGLGTLIVLFYKELLINAFDPQMAEVMGLYPRAFRYGLMAVLSITVVGGFTAVGAVLVVAMLIAPAATAYLITTRLRNMFIVSAFVGCLSSLIGFHVAYWLSVSTGGAMVCVACGLFSLAFLFAPRDGIVASAWRRSRRRWHAAEENIVRHAWKLSHAAGSPTKSSPRLASTVLNRAALRRELQLSGVWLEPLLWALQWRGWLEPAGDRTFRLTAAGVQQGQRLDRAHRLWETYLVDQVGVASDHVHPAAEEVEHVLSEQFVEEVDDLLGHPDVDPHGAPIPRSPVSDVLPGAFTLSKLRVGDQAIVVGMRGGPAPCVPPIVPQSEPVQLAPTAEAAIAALELPLGQTVQVVSRDAGISSWTIAFPDGKLLKVSHETADRVLVQIVSESEG